MTELHISLHLTIVENIWDNVRTQLHKMYNTSSVYRHFNTKMLYIISLNMMQVPKAKDELFTLITATFDQTPNNDYGPKDIQILQLHETNMKHEIFTCEEPASNFWQFFFHESRIKLLFMLTTCWHFLK